MNFIAVVAMALDTLPAAGRILLLALLLSWGLFGFTRTLPDDAGSSLNVLYRKGALLALLLVPAMVYLLNIQVSVPVTEITRFVSPIPGYVVAALLFIWTLGCLRHLFRLAMDLRETYATLTSYTPVPSHIEARARHWQNRLNLKGELRVLCGGAEHAWHIKGVNISQPWAVVLPAAAPNWPTGVVDAMLLMQLAQMYQGSWCWLVLGRVVEAIYWPTPWVSTLVQQLASHMRRPGLKLAAAAYRDPEGWQRDLRNLYKRLAGLRPIEASSAASFTRVPSADTMVTIDSNLQPASQQDDDFESKWQHTKRSRREKTRDPYPQAYWLIAMTSIVVGIASTLTLVEVPPQFDPEYLDIKWLDQMVRQVREE